MKNYQQKLLTNGLSYAKVFNSNNGVYEGTFKELLLANTYKTNNETTRNSLVYSFRNMSYFSVLRPLLKDENGNYTGKYYYATFGTQKNAIPAGLKCNSRELLDYTIVEDDEVLGIVQDIDYNNGNDLLYIKGNKGI